VIKGIVEPYLAGIKFKFEYTTFEPSEVADIGIYETDDTQSNFEDVVEYGDDVSDEFIHTSKKKEKDELKTSSTASSKNVFIVHGRDHEPMKELKTMLLEFGLNPIVLHEQPSGSRTIVEKLEEYSDVGYAFVILTPDDKASSKEELLKMQNKFLNDLTYVLKEKQKLSIVAESFLDELELTMKQRARQNVVLEFGYFMGKLSRTRVCCLYKGDIELPSDMHGIVYISFKESLNEARSMIEKELREAGYEIKK
jgi:predicted nucleotide-binding protein